MAHGGARKGAGRPKGSGGGQRPQMKVVLDPEQDEAAEALAAKTGKSKAAAIRRILDAGIGALRAIGEIPPAGTNQGATKG
jgi:hypothetical protein